MPQIKCTDPGQLIARISAIGRALARAESELRPGVAVARWFTRLGCKTNQAALSRCRAADLFVQIDS